MTEEYERIVRERALEFAMSHYGQLNIVTTDQVLKTAKLFENYIVKGETNVSRSNK